jgi:hypothetical protein
MARAWIMIGVIAAAGLLGGCGTHSYVTPGRGVPMSLFCGPPTVRDSLTDPGVREVLVKQPLAMFPATMAVARVQESGYRNRCVGSWGSGTYSVVTGRDVETPADFERLQKLYLVRNVAPLNRLVVSEQLNNDEELRRSAASLGADLLLIYTFDTTFTSDDWAPPLAVITLGLFPTYSIKVQTTASLALLDVRNGFVYGTGEASSKKSGISNAWTDDSALESVRKKAERDALDGLLANLEKSWGQIVVSNAMRPIVPPQASAYPPVEREPSPLWTPREWIQVYPAPERPQGKLYRTGP